jgi:SAM-dependent methyltransferase
MAVHKVCRRLARFWEPASRLRALPSFGLCASCRRPTAFLRIGNRALAAEMNAWPYPVEVLQATATRENYYCLWCRRNWRMRQLAAAAWPHIEGSDVFEPADHGVLARRLRRRAKSYVVSEYLDRARPGERVGDIEHQDLQNLTFEDDAFDLVLTSEVFEHVDDPWAGFREVRRVLRPGGRHLFTVPSIPGTVTASRRGLPDVHHGDPIRSDGALVVTDFGDDLPELLSPLGFNTTVLSVPAGDPILRIYDSVAV